MLLNNRVIFNNAGTLTDASIALSNIHSSSQVFDIQSATDYIYLGSDLPFNHRHIDLVAVNSNAASVSIDLWDGTSWVPAIDIIDQTVVTGATLAQDGIIAWRPDEDESSWSWDDTDDMANSGLQTLKIKGLYWARMSFSADLSSTLSFNYIGYKFSKDEELESEYPELSLSTMKAAFKTGKTDWNEQALVAAEYIINDLRQMNVITSQNQILDWRVFSKASVHKTAEIVFRAFGDDYKDNMLEANKQYKLSLQAKQYNVDQNRDATLTEAETKPITTFLER